jgi:peptidoglycan/LPS O-acetylase OafA/YrhL
LSNAEVQAGLATYQLQHWVRMLSCFLAGSVFYRYRDRIPYSPRWMVLAGTLMLTLFFSGYGFVALLPILGAYVVLYLAFERRLLCTAFGQRGDHSYGIYLYAFPVQQLLIFGLHGWLTSWTLFALAWGVTAVCAWMSWVFVERPFLRRG